MKLLKFAEFVNEMLIIEGGNAIEESRPLEQYEIDGTYDFVVKKIFSLLGLVDGESAKPIGSYKKKLPNQTSGDIDIACHVETMAGFAGISVDFVEILNWMDSTLKKAGFQTVVSFGFKQISIGTPIEGKTKNGIAQVDLMLTEDMEWSTFMYHSPDFTKAESKYKGMYRNVLLTSIISEGTKKTVKKTDKGEIEEYEHQVIHLEKGLASTRKSLMGKKGLIVKTATILKEFDKFITSTPSEVVKTAFGSEVAPSNVMTFEDIWRHFIDPKFIHKDKFDAILNRFKIYILSSKVPVPTEVTETYPNLFK